MANSENLQYTVTFKTRAEGTGAKETADAMKRINDETARKSALSTPEETRASTSAQYDLSKAIAETERETKKATFVTNEAAFAKVRARQAAEDLIAQLRLEEIAKKKSAQASAGAGAASRAMGSQVQNASYQVQDIAVQLAAGTSAATALGQQLPQLLGGFGMWGALAGGVVALGALVLNLNKAKDKTKELSEEAKKLKEQLEDLQNTHAEKFADDYARSIGLAADYTEDLRQNELARISTAAKLAEINREIRATQDAMTGAAIDFMEATTGVDMSRERAALRERERLRTMESGSAAAIAQIAKEEQALENLNKKIAELEENKAQWEKDRRESLAQQQSDLGRDIGLARLAGKEGRAADLEQQLKNVTATAAKVDGMIEDAAVSIGNLTRESFAKAMEIDQLKEINAAEMEKLNAELAKSTNQESFDSAMEKSKQLTGEINNVLGTYQAQTPVQAEAVATLQAAMADGKVTADEIVKVTGAVQVMMGTIKSGQESNVTVLNNVTGLLQKFDQELRAANRKIEQLQNGVR